VAWPGALAAGGGYRQVRMTVPCGGLVPRHVLRDKARHPATTGTNSG
jgi:hypothetical protein